MNTRFLLIIICLSLIHPASGSFVTGKASDTAVGFPQPAATEHKRTGIKRLSPGEKSVNFFSWRQIKKGGSSSEEDLEKEVKKANDDAKLSFIFSVLTFILPPLIVPTVILKGSASKRKNLLTPKNRRRLKVADFILKFWLVAFALIAVAMVGALFYFMFRVVGIVL